MSGWKGERAGAAKRNRATDRRAPGHTGALDLGIVVALILSTLAVYGQVAGHGFVSYDDPVYVVDNLRVRSGLQLENVGWAFTTFHFSNWHPLTWISYMLDSHLFGVDPGAMHLVNLFLHLVNALLVYALFRVLTGARWRPALVAGLFALHPLHVESVAWISERKDVLSTLLGLLALLAYTGYARRGGNRRYLVCLLCFALGLMAKPMLVTLPFAFLLIDYWPLARLRFDATGRNGLASLGSLVREKLPFFALSLIASALALAAQQHGGAILELPFSTRTANVAVAYVWYLAKTVWPLGLAPFYPYAREGVSVWLSVGSLVLLPGVTACALGPLRGRRYLTVGWLFYLGTLVPVIGIVQVGAQATADRYSYVPLLGIFVAAAWALGEFAERIPRLRNASVVAALIALTTLGAVAFAQVGRWRDSLTLFEHTIAVTADNPVSLVHYANALQEGGRLDEAIENHRAALALEPNFGDALVSLGNALVRKAQPGEATPLFARALAARPDWDVALLGRGNAQLAEGDPDAALVSFRRVIELSPELAEGHNATGAALARRGDLPEAIRSFEMALRLKAELPEARRNLEATRRELERRSALPSPEAVH